MDKIACRYCPLRYSNRAGYCRTKSSVFSVMPRAVCVGSVIVANLHNRRPTHGERRCHRRRYPFRHRAGFGLGVPWAKPFPGRGCAKAYRLPVHIHSVTITPSAAPAGLAPGQRQVATMRICNGNGYVNFAAYSARKAIPLVWKGDASVPDSNPATPPVIAPISDLVPRCLVWIAPCPVPTATRPAGQTPGRP